MTSKKTLKSLLVVVMLIAAFAAAYFVPALAQPGDTNDPAITRSYLNHRISELRAEIDGLRAVITSGTSAGFPDITIPGTGVTPGSTTPQQEELFMEFIRYFESLYGEVLNAALSTIWAAEEGMIIPFTPLNIPAGSSLIAEAGAEFILRSGSATAVSGPDGMVNVTTGVDIVNGNPIPTNHLLLVPRSDGRGFVALTDVWVMIKGGFEIVY